MWLTKELDRTCWLNNNSVSPLIPEENQIPQTYTLVKFSILLTKPNSVKRHNTSNENRMKHWFQWVTQNEKYIIPIDSKNTKILIMGVLKKYNHIWIFFLLSLFFLYSFFSVFYVFLKTTSCIRFIIKLKLILLENKTKIQS